MAHHLFAETVQISLAELAPHNPLFFPQDILVRVITGTPLGGGYSALCPAPPSGDLRVRGANDVGATLTQIGYGLPPRARSGRHLHHSDAGVGYG
ncbi:hypothetical protein ACFC3O_11615 [Streptomyces sp. NPDC056007]|uniref:hypothetical protein n=1 Tax=Streptomyces sp. NPDC056007 TaxID=3345678 RepID=UPI0035D578FD